MENKKNKLVSKEELKRIEDELKRLSEQLVYSHGRKITYPKKMSFEDALKKLCKESEYIKSEDLEVILQTEDMIILREKDTEDNYFFAYIINKK